MLDVVFRSQSVQITIFENKMLTTIYMEISTCTQECYNFIIIVIGFRLAKLLLAQLSAQISILENDLLNFTVILDSINTYSSARKWVEI
jgi:hypothetical protein